MQLSKAKLISTRRAILARSHFNVLQVAMSTTNNNITDNNNNNKSSHNNEDNNKLQEMMKILESKLYVHEIDDWYTISRPLVMWAGYRSLFKKYLF